MLNEGKTKKAKPVFTAHVCIKKMQSLGNIYRAIF